MSDTHGMRGWSGVRPHCGPAPSVGADARAQLPGYQTPPGRWPLAILGGYQSYRWGWLRALGICRGSASNTPMVSFTPFAFDILPACPFSLQFLLENLSYPHLLFYLKITKGSSVFLTCPLFLPFPLKHLT